MPKPCALLLTVLLWLPVLPGTALAQETGALPAARIAVSPPRLEIDLDAGGRSTEALHVINLSDEETHLSVSVAHWDLDENNKVRNIAPTEQSLDQWMVVNPLEFTIPPHEKQTIRFAVRPRIRPEPGEHRAMIYLEQQPDAAGGETAVSVLYRLGVAVYGLSGQIDRRGRIRAIRHSQSDENHFLVVDASSEGNASVRLAGQYGIWQKADFPGEEAATALLDLGRTPVADTLAATGSLPELPILPGTERSIPTRLQWPAVPGNYILFVNGKIAGRPFKKNLEISVP
jgi:hypothetical protein